MIHRLTNHNAEAIALQNAAELRRSQSAAAPATKFNLAEILGGAGWEETAGTGKSTAATKASLSGFSDAIATATTPVVQSDTGARELVTTPITVASRTTSTPTTTVGTTATAATTGAGGTAATASTTPTGTPAAAVTTPGVGALVTAVMSGSFQPTYVTDPSQLQETTYAGNATLPNFYFASDQTATQLASLLGGTVVKLPPFGQQGGSEPDANFIQLPNGQTFNAADVAHLAASGSEGGPQLTADITSTINQGSAWTHYYQQGGQMPTFAMGYVGPPITGMTYPASMIGADGNVINPAMTQSATAAA